MTTAWRTFWRRFFLMERPTAWSASRLRSEPELAHIPPTDSYFTLRARVHRLARWYVPSMAAGMAIALVYLVVTSMLYPLLSGAAIHGTSGTHASSMRSMHRLIALGMAAAVGAQYLGLMAIVLWWSARASRRMRRRLRTELRSRAVPVCLACGYVGGDMHARNCPECGRTHAPG